MRLVKVRQRLASNPIDDVTAEVRRQLDRLGPPPQGEVAVTVGSRGIDNLVEITRATGDWLRDHGAEPFVIPSMGSHNGATAEGQREMVESLGCTEAATGMPIRSSMECVQVGEVPTGPVWMDRHTYESAGVLVVNRVKLHTCFSGPVQSGLTKMMVVGMGKIRSAETFHSAPTPRDEGHAHGDGRACSSTRARCGPAWRSSRTATTRRRSCMRLPAAHILDREPELLANAIGSTSHACR